jgi:acyl-CoA synthetase (AMP-forming)/AMP-acid ligase II
MHSDGYVEIKDRAKDIIISGGENISSLGVEEVLYKHPDVMEAAVVARPDAKWDETPQAFCHAEARRRGRDRGRHHRLVPGASGAFQVPAFRHLRRAAEDLDGEDPEVRVAAARPGRFMRSEEPAP